MQVAGAVLAGGASTRMGRTKLLIEVGGVPMGRIVADVLYAGGCAPVAYIGGDPDEIGLLDGEFVADRHPGEGPLGGVLTALQHFTTATHVLVAAGDLPLLDARTVRIMLDAAARAPAVAAVVAHSGRRDPGLVVWNRDAVNEIATAFDSGVRAVHTVLDRIETIEQRVDATVMRNVNRPDDVPGQ